MFVSYNANPDQNRTTDCAIRAISTVLGQDWEQTYIGVVVEGFMLHDMPDANHVWGSYLKSKGFIRRAIPDECPDCYTVSDFCRDNPQGVYLLAVSGHVIAVIDGNYYDTWDSGGEIPIYFWTKKGGQ